MIVGYNDNGSGLVALLEIVRAFSWAKCQLKYTLIAVALDLEEYGVQGGTAFVQEYLMEHILKPFNYPKFQVQQNTNLHIITYLFQTKNQVYSVIL